MSGNSQLQLWKWGKISKHHIYYYNIYLSFITHIYHIKQQYYHVYFYPICLLPWSHCTLFIFNNLFFYHTSTLYHVAFPNYKPSIHIWFSFLAHTYFPGFSIRVFYSYNGQDNLLRGLHNGKSNIGWHCDMHFLVTIVYVTLLLPHPLPFPHLPDTHTHTPSSVPVSVSLSSSFTFPTNYSFPSPLPSTHSSLSLPPLPLLFSFILPSRVRLTPPSHPQKNTRMSHT